VTGADAAVPQPVAEVTAVGRSGRAAALQLSVRTVVIRLVSLLGTALLARILLPQDFGIFAVVAFIVGFVGPLGDFGLGPALVQQVERPTQREIATVFTSQLLISTAVTAFVWLAAPLARIVAPTLPVDTEWMIRVTALALPLTALRAVASSMMARVLRFGPLATIEITQQLVYFGSAIVLALAGFGAWCFVWALVFQLSVAAVLTNLAWGGRLRLGLDRSTVRRMLAFGVPFQATSFVLSVRDAVVPLFGGLAGGPPLAAIGYLQFGQRMGRLAGSIDEVVGRISFPAFSRLQGDSGRGRLALVWSVEVTSLFMAGALCWTVIVAPSLIPFVFSDRWSPAVPVFQWTAIGTMALVPASFVRGLAFAAGAARSMLSWSVVTLALAVILFPALLIALGLVGGGLAFAIYAFVQLLGYVHATRALAPFPWLRMARIYLLGWVCALVGGLVDAAIGGLPGLVVSGALYVFLFGLALVLFERDQLRRAWQLVRGQGRAGAGSTSLRSTGNDAPDMLEASK
jgi:PST family polysaccharide transporter